MLEGQPDPLEEMIGLRSVAEQRLDAAIDHGDPAQIQDWVKRIAELDKSLRQYGIEVAGWSPSSRLGAKGDTARNCPQTGRAARPAVPSGFPLRAPL